MKIEDTLPDSALVHEQSLLVAEHLLAFTDFHMRELVDDEFGSFKNHGPLLPRWDFARTYQRLLVLRLYVQHFPGFLGLSPVARNLIGAALVEFLRAADSIAAESQRDLAAYLFGTSYLATAESISDVELELAGVSRLEGPDWIPQFSPKAEAARIFCQQYTRWMEYLVVELTAMSASCDEKCHAVRAWHAEASRWMAAARARFVVQSLSTDEYTRVTRQFAPNLGDGNADDCARLLLAHMVSGCTAAWAKLDK